MGRSGDILSHWLFYHDCASCKAASRYLKSLLQYSLPLQHLGVGIASSGQPYLCFVCYANVLVEFPSGCVGLI